jgi:hypothetical protein
MNLEGFFIGALRLFGKNLEAFLSALHVSRILLRTPRKGTAFGCLQTTHKGVMLRACALSKRAEAHPSGL